MQTDFTAAQLRDPAIREAADILGTCVHYGFCTNTCPTYVLSRDENESPRGRIDLIREMLESEAPPKAQTVAHLDSCLSCLSCMTTCAAKVDYAHLIDRARVHVERRHRRPLAERALRALLGFVLPRPRLFQVALALGRLGRPIQGLLPSRLRPVLAMIPERTQGRILAPQVFEAEGERRARVALLAGCAQQVLDGNINTATIRLLTRHGCEVVVAAGAGCCGSLTLHMGREEEAMAAAAANVRSWMRERRGEGLDAVIVNASGCGTTVKDYGHLLARTELAGEAREVAGIARDVTEFIAGIGLRPAAPERPRLRVTYHDACSMQHGQRVTRPPRDLLRAAGFEVVDVPEKHFCCGSAGTYNLLQPATAETLGGRKAGHIDSTAPDVVAAGNIGCLTQLRRYVGAPMAHTVELLDWATGGPLPPALAGVALQSRPAPQPEEAPAAAAAPAPNDDAGFW
ncbi:2-hydroxy-acid oxidase [Bosea sp. Root483D1]|uniref:glycolate oxidase subunit GlcF n=1 Tax=Bosea sp. Root483D1 TaxID=1736544 RepID=UPI00070A9692|nr:glycolate oxidase subunit GlcF [Bosea sp. Root483D1]KRE12520.1 2-hydroxy-acid oxidase [Bosea sp. Root483D1]